jgi:hypothetical protein
MTSKTLKSAIWLTLAAGTLTVAAGGAAYGKGGPPTSESAQNLSVPTIMVGGSAGGLTCGIDADSPSVLRRPTGTPLTGYEVAGYYWVQKVHTWQAQCFAADTALVHGAWGDNLEGDAKLKVGSPIRVELVLDNLTDYSATTGPLLGYTVMKLEPSKLDRYSAYGHLAGGDAEFGFTDLPATFTFDQWLVHDAGITFSVQNLTTLAYAVPLGTSPTAEINATGKVVYGYNLRVTEQGPYRITFKTSSAVKFDSVDIGGLIDLDGDESNGYEAVFIDITVVGGGGSRPPRN